MPKLGCNGFSLFAEQMRPSLEELKGKCLGKFNDLISAAGPYWQGLPEDEKREWKERARHYKRSDTYHAKKKHQRHRRLPDSKNRRMVFGHFARSHNLGANRKPLESDLAPSDTLDPNELPGPVSRPPIPLPTISPPPPLPTPIRHTKPTQSKAPPGRGVQTRPNQASPPLNASSAPSVRVMELVGGCGVVVSKALARLGLIGPSGRILPQARLLLPPPPNIARARPPETSLSSSADEMDDLSPLLIPSPICLCCIPRTTQRRKPLHKPTFNSNIQTSTFQTNLPINLSRLPQSISQSPNNSSADDADDED